MADVLMWFLLILGIMLVFLGHWMVAVALFPALVSRARAQYSRPVRLTLLGLLFIAPLIALAALFLAGNNSAMKLIGAFLIGVPIVVGLAGSAGLSEKVGLGLPSPRDDVQPWRRVLRGGSVLVLTFLLPFAGWFALLPWTLVSGFAAAMLSCKPGRTDAAAVSAMASATAPSSPPPVIATAREMAG